MNENTERGKGKLQELGGSLKERVGELTGNERMQAEGEADQLEGKGRQTVARGVGAVKGAAEDAKGNVMQGIGKLTGDDSTRAEGMGEEAKGNVRRDVNS